MTSLDEKQVKNIKRKCQGIQICNLSTQYSFSCIFYTILYNLLIFQINLIIFYICTFSFKNVLVIYALFIFLLAFLI